MLPPQAVPVIFAKTVPISVNWTFWKPCMVYAFDFNQLLSCAADQRDTTFLLMDFNYII